MLQQDMIQQDHTFLFRPHKAKKNPIVRERILAVSLHLNQNMPIVDMAGRWDVTVNPYTTGLRSDLV